MLAWGSLLERFRTTCKKTYSGTNIEQVNVCKNINLNMGYFTMILKVCLFQNINRMREIFHDYVHHFIAPENIFLSHMVYNPTRELPPGSSSKLELWELCIAQQTK